MRITQPRTRLAGSVLIISLITCAILGTVLASYLILVQTQSISVMRSQTWNASIAITEAGVEEALSQINRNAPFFEISDATNGLTANSWTQNGNVFTAPRRYMGRSYYDVSITLNGLQPFINATGVVWMADSYSYHPTTLFAAWGMNGADPSFQARGVLVNTRMYPLFAVAMAAIQTIDFKGNNVWTDSFDSGDPNYSENGLYPVGQPSKIKANGDVCTDATIINSINVGNANINGRAVTGPNGTVYVGPNGHVSGGIFDDFDVVFPPVTLPSATWLYAGTGTYVINGKTYKHVIMTSGDYYLDGLKGGLFINTNAHVRLLLTANTKITGNSDEIRLSRGAGIILYASTASFSMAGNGLVNDTGNAANFLYLGLPAHTSVNFNGNAAFTGAIYSPNAAFTLGGGGNDVYDFVGASVSKTVVMNGHFNFHYDEGLRRWGPGRGFIPTRWTEL